MTNLNVKPCYSCLPCKLVRHDGSHTLCWRHFNEMMAQLGQPAITFHEWKAAEAPKKVAA